MAYCMSCCYICYLPYHPNALFKYYVPTALMSQLLISANSLWNPKRKLCRYLSTKDEGYYVVLCYVMGLLRRGAGRALVDGIMEYGT